MEGPVQVDPEALERLGRRLLDLQARLDWVRRDIGTFDTAIGSPKLKAVLSELVSSWAQSRRALGEELAALGSLASAAAAQYRATEASVATDVGRLPGGARPDG